MIEGLRPLVISADLDRTTLVGPIAYGTYFQLKRGQLKLPEEGCENPPWVRSTSLGGVLKAAADYALHAARWPIIGSKEGLLSLRRIAEDFGREVRVVALSGRTPEKHDMTHRRLALFGFSGVFDEVYLNGGKSSYIWKEDNHQRWVDEGANVLHLEDDLRAGLVSDRINQRVGERRVVTCLFQNRSNNPRLVEQAGVIVPGSVKYVQNHDDVVDVLVNLLESGRF